MKKIVSFLMAAMLLVSTVSAQQGLVKRQKNTKEAFNVSMVKKQQNKKVKTVASASKGVAGRFAIPLKKVASKTAYTVSSWTARYYDADNDWFCTLTEENEAYAFYFDIIDDTLVWGHTYTIADMIPEYTLVQDLITYDTVRFSAATFVYGVDANGLEYINATATDNLGETYTITYQEQPIPVPTDTIDVVMTTNRMIDYTVTDGVFQFMGTNEDGYEASVAVYSNSLVGSFTNDDVYTDYTYLYSNDSEINVRAVSGSVVANANDGYDMEAYMIAQNAHCYHVVFSYSDPVATDTIQVVATNLEIDDSYAMFGLYSVMASNADYEFSMMVMANSVEGTFTLDDCYSLALTDHMGAVDPYSASITIANTANGYTLTGGILGYDNHYYDLDFSFVMPEPTRTETIVAAGELVNATSEGWFQALGYNADSSRAASYTVNAYQLVGTFGNADFDRGYTFVYDNPTDQSLAVAYRMLSGEVTVTVDGSSNYATLNGTMLCVNTTDPTDVPLYTIQMTCAITVPGMQYDAEDEDYEEHFRSDQFTIDDQYFEQYGEVDVNGEFANAIATVSFILDELDPNTIIPVGTYPINDSQEAGTVIASPGVQSGYVYPSFAGYLDEEGYIQTPLWFLEDGTATVSFEGGSLSIIVNATNSYGRTIYLAFEDWVGINTVDNVEVSVYPNPACDVLNVNAEGVKKIEVINANGSVVMTSEKAGAINISTLSNGIYMVRTLTNAGVNVQKIVKK